MTLDTASFGERCQQGFRRDSDMPVLDLLDASDTQSNAARAATIGRRRESMSCVVLMVADLGKP